MAEKICSLDYNFDIMLIRCDLSTLTFDHLTCNAYIAVVNKLTSMNFSCLPINLSSAFATYKIR